MALLLLQLQTMAGTSVSTNSNDDAAANFDESEIYSSFDQINDLVTYVSENDGVTYADLQSENSSLVENVASSSAVALNNTSAGEPPIVSAFWWGCILNWVGIVIVMLTTDMDTAQIMKSVWGCVVGTVCIAAFELIYVLALGGTYFWY